MSQSQIEHPGKSDDTDIINFTGKIEHIQIEGGFWGLISDDGKHYDPMNKLDQEFKKSGLRVSAKLKLRKGMIHFHMWGKMVEVLELHKIPD